MYDTILKLRTGYIHEIGQAASSFLSIEKYAHANRWADLILQRPAVQRGMTVCSNGVGKPWLENKSAK